MPALGAIQCDEDERASTSCAGPVAVNGERFAEGTQVARDVGEGGLQEGVRGDGADGAAADAYQRFVVALIEVCGYVLIWDLQLILEGEHLLAIATATTATSEEVKENTWWA